VAYPDDADKKDAKKNIFRFSHWPCGKQPLNHPDEVDNTKGANKEFTFLPGLKNSIDA
jgi:hypothetical protein